MKRTMMLALGLGLFGCDDPLKTVELVAEPRLLGARVEVERDATLAAPAPGERASVTFLVASPSEISLGFALGACGAAPRNGARADCASPVFSSVLAKNGEFVAPKLDFEVPAALEASGRVLVQGVVCPEGSPAADGQRCDNGAGLTLQLELELARAGDVNSNPELQPESIRFDDEAWPDLTALDGDCAELGLPEVQPGSEHTVGVMLDEGDRDALPRANKLEPSRESLQLGHFVSGGDITRAFESIAWNSDELERRVAWTAPTQPGLVRFWFVLRDFRGGGAFAARAVCVKN